MRAVGLVGVRPETAALWDAVDDGDERRVKDLIAAGASATAANRMGFTALHRACMHGHVHVVRVLLGHATVDVNAADCAGNTPLVMAVGKCHAALVQPLLQAKADPLRTRDDGRTALHVVCAEGCGAAGLELLRQVGALAAGCTVRDSDGRTPHDLLETHGDESEDEGMTAIRTILRPTAISPSESARYSRHLLLRDVGVAGQERLKASTVLCVGVGGLGCPSLLYLAASGVGEIILVDGDTVDESNLQRQVAHDTSTIGMPKVQSAAARLRAINPAVRLRCEETHLASHNALALVARCDVALDCTDSIAARYLLDDACAELGRPLVYGAVFQWEGHVAAFRHDRPGGAGYADLYPTPPPQEAVPSCTQAGVVGVVPGTIGMLQATEAIKVLLKVGESLDNRLLIYNALDMTFTHMPIVRRPDYTGRGARWARRHEVPSAACEAATVPSVQAIQPVDAARRLSSGWEPFILDVRSAAEAHISCLSRTDMRKAHDELSPEDLAGLPVERDVLVYCRSGARSAAVCSRLAQGRGGDGSRIFNLDGGINRWARDTDPSMLIY